MNEISNCNLSNNVEIIDYVSHNKVIEFQKKSQVLLLIVNNVPSAKSIITGKIFEYLMVKRPILAIAPTNGDLAEIIEQTNSGVVVEFLLTIMICLKKRNFRFVFNNLRKHNNFETN